MAQQCGGAAPLTGASWVVLLGICRFDALRGHVLEWYEPQGVALSPTETAELAMLSMPDTGKNASGAGESEYSFRCVLRGLVLHAWVRYDARRDPLQQRGALQRSAVLLSALPFEDLWFPLLRVLLAAHMERVHCLGASADEEAVAASLLASAATQLAQWPPPLCCGLRPALPFLGSVLSHVAPCFRQRGFDGVSVPPPLPCVVGAAARAGLPPLPLGDDYVNSDDEGYVVVDSASARAGLPRGVGSRCSLDSAVGSTARSDERRGGSSSASPSPTTQQPNARDSKPPSRVRSSGEGLEQLVAAASDISELLAPAPHLRPSSAGGPTLGGACYAIARLAVNIAQAEAMASEAPPRAGDSFRRARPGSGSLVTMGLAGRPPVSLNPAPAPRREAPADGGGCLVPTCPAARGAAPGDYGLGPLAGHAARLWKLWELAVCGEPLAVFAPDAAAASCAVLAVASLTSPLLYGGTLQPYLPLQSSGADGVAGAACPSAPAAVIAGAANPYFVRTWRTWPHLLAVGPGGAGAWDPAPAAAKHWRRTSRLRSALAHAPRDGLFSDRAFCVEPDLRLVHAVHSAKTDAEQAAAEAALRAHFRQLSCELVAPLAEVADAALAAAAPDCFADLAAAEQWRELRFGEARLLPPPLQQLPPPFEDLLPACAEAARGAAAAQRSIIAGGAGGDGFWGRRARDPVGLALEFVHSPTFLRFLMERYSAGRREWLIRHQDLPSLLLTLASPDSQRGALDLIEALHAAERAAASPDWPLLEVQVPEFRAKLGARQVPRQ